MFKTKRRILSKAKACKNFTLNSTKVFRKILAVGASFSLMFGMVPSSVVSAAEPTSFVTKAYANHWGRSDLRAYLNNGTKGDLNMSNCSNSANYPSYFNDEEYALVEPHTYSTNEFADYDNDETVTCVHETTDKFWLPSGNCDNNLVLSWGSEDISGDSHYTASTQNDIQRLIPRSYWSHGSNYEAWARSPFYIGVSCALVASRGDNVNYDYVFYDGYAVATAFKIPLSYVIFTSAASAANPAVEEGGKEIEIDGSADFGKAVEDALPNYGMYLKKESEDKFEATGLALNGSNINVTYTGGVVDQYIMVQAFKSDDLINGTKSYVVGKQLTSLTGSLGIDISKWNLTSLDDYTIKVWMEDASGGSSLAPATTPVTFVGTSKTEEGAATNARVFAMKEDLKCSWGTLANADSLAGDDATNQKIYFGSDGNNPLEFWIAGRENSTNNYQIDPDGDIMTLYQAVSVGGSRQFNDSFRAYEGNKSRVTLQLDDNAEFRYTETETTVKYTGTTTAKVVNTEDDSETDIPTESLKWQYRTGGSGTWNDGMPTSDGEYELRCYAPGDEDSYEQAYSPVVTFTVSGVPAGVSEADGELTYSGSSLSSSNHNTLFLILTISILAVVGSVAAYWIFLRKKHKNNV